LNNGLGNRQITSKTRIIYTLTLSEKPQDTKPHIMEKILAIDDNNDNLISLNAVIKEAFPESTVFTALNGPKGIKLAIDNDPDVILLDIIMPDMDGFEVCRQLKQDERVKHIPVVFLTAAKDDTINRIKALEMGAEAFLYKPIDEPELTAQIRAMVKIKKANRSILNEKEHLALLVSERTMELEKSQSETLKMLSKLKVENELRKQTELDLIAAKDKAVESEKYLENIINSMGDPVFVKDDQSRLLLVNNAFCSIFNLARDLIIGKTLAEEESSEEREIFLRIDNQVLSDGKENIQEELLTVRGRQTKTISTRKSRFIDKNGKKHLIGVIRDLTERKQVEVALQESDANLKAIIENSIESIWSIDTNYQIRYVNEVFISAFKESFGVTISKGVNLIKALPENLRPKWIERYTRAFKGESFIFLDEVDIGDSTIYIEVAMNPISVEGKVVAASFYGKNITEQKNYETRLIEAKERSEESDRLKSAFLANMSHEIRTPMNGILGFADLLKKPDLTGEKQQKYISIIQKSGVRMLNIINDIVSISKIESGLMETNLQASNINEQVEYIYTFFKPEIEGKGIQFSFNNSLTAKEAILNTDREKVYAILTNLVKNAAKYTEKGSIEIGYNRKGEFIKFYVKDTGIGIPKNRQEAIFERFIQADLLDPNAYEGAGLGLSISKAYLEMLGGKIWVKSRPGKGSTFYFTLPLKDETVKKSITNNEILHSDDQLPGINLKILVAEDDETSEELISIALQEFGDEIINVKTGAEAVAACLNNPDINLVMMDIRMPEMDGYEATRKIRKFNKEVIIIVQTAYALEGDKEKALTAGCNDYMSKPVMTDELELKIKKFFKK
jgi:PAS domain S-box-containing protein